ncbi:uncharacterized protein LOC135400707 [Ornithodoros turicata]|uniref:uncharacterized protein LOC135400707 n=1 Tax=Ornithodoros turicata TaxID=34597 RepID=UPI0031390DF7
MSIEEPLVDRYNKSLPVRETRATAFTVIGGCILLTHKLPSLSGVQDTWAVGLVLRSTAVQAEFVSKVAPRPLLPCCCCRNRVDVTVKMPLTVALFVGSCRVGRMADRVLKLVRSQLEERGHQVLLIDPLEESNLLAVRQPVHFHGPDEKVAPWLDAVHQKVLQAEAFLVLSPEYNRCIGPALTSAMNHFPPSSYRHKPCAVVCYSIGTGGGQSAAAQLRSFLGELGAVTVPTVCMWPKVHETISESGVTENHSVKSSLGQLLTELEWYGTALLNHKGACGMPS